MIVKGSVVGFYRQPSRRGAASFVTVWVQLPKEAVPVDGGSAYSQLLLKDSDCPAGDLLTLDCLVDVDRFGRAGLCKILTKGVNVDGEHLDASDAVHH